MTQGCTQVEDRPGERAAPSRVGLLSVHTSPLEQAGSGDSGGLNVSLVWLARHLSGAGVETHVFTRASGADLPPAVPLTDGVTVHHIKAGPPQLDKDNLATHLCGFYLGLAAHPVTPTLDLLHGHYWMSGWVGRQARRRLGLPLVQTFHTLARQKNAALAPGDKPEPALRVTAEERVVADADAIIAPTPAEVALLREAYRAHPARVHLVPPGVDLAVFNPDGDRAAERAALGGGRLLLFVGRLQPLKAPDVAVRTLAALDGLLPDDGMPTRLLIVGGASGSGRGTCDQQSLRRLAAGLGVADRVAFLAPRPQTELAALYRAADVVLMPSHSESFGLVALEAQACGTPVVATGVGGLRHVLGGGGGTLVDGHDPRAHAAAALPYLVDPAVRAATGAAGVRVAAAHSWERTTAGTLDVYRRVASRLHVPATGRRGA